MIFYRKDFIFTYYSCAPKKLSNEFSWCLNDVGRVKVFQAQVGGGTLRKEFSFCIFLGRLKTGMCHYYR